MRTCAFCFWAIALTAFAAAPAGAADDTNRDYAFNPPIGGSFVSFDLLPDKRDVASDVAVQPNGKIVLAGRAGSASGRRGALARLTADGAPDPTFFSTSGRRTFQFGTADTIVNAVALQPDGGIIVAGELATSALGRGFVARFTDSGAIDTRFGLLGFVALRGLIRDLTVHPDGRIIAVGSLPAAIPTASDMAVHALLPSGLPDLTFGSAGTATISFTPAGSTTVAASVAVQTDGKIVVAGDSQSASIKSRFVIARLDPDGSLDTGFGTGGRQTMAFDWCWSNVGHDDVWATALALGPSGRIVIGGVGGADLSCDAPSYTLALAILNANGQPDTSINGDGRQYAKFFSSDPFEYEWLSDLVIEPDGRILFTGTVASGGRLRLGVARLLPNTELDYTFAGDGVGLYDFYGTFPTAGAAIALQGDRPVVAGTVDWDGAGDTDFVAIRLVSDRIFATGMQVQY